MMTNSVKNTFISIAACIVTVCIITLVYIFVLHPQSKAIRALDDSISQSQQELINIANGHSSDNSELREELSLASKNLRRYVVSPAQASDFTVDIGKIAKDAGGLKQFSSTNRMQESYGSINECRHILEGRIQINFKSSFLKFASFLNLLERNEPVIFVDYFKIKRSSSGGDNDVDMVLTFFVGKDSLKDILAVDEPDAPSQESALSFNSE